MKILSTTHLFLPNHFAGAEVMLHEINKYLVSKGHEVKVLAGVYEVTYKYEDIGVYPESDSLFEWADIIITHLDYTLKAVDAAENHNKKIVHIIHNDIHENPYINNPRTSAFLYNSQWLAKKLAKPLPSIVVNPPCDRKRFTGLGNFNSEYVTLINLNKNKGGKFLYELAALMPDTNFQGVEGAYGDQIKKALPNVELKKPTPDIEGVYYNTKVLLIPSAYESWGSVASEAMAAGIPIIANPTPGLIENCGDAALYCDINNIHHWRNAILALQNERYWNERSQLGLKRAIEHEVSTKFQLEALEKFIINFSA